MDGVERLQLRARAGERLVPGRLRLRRDERVEQRHLRAPEAQMIAGRRSQPRDQRVPPEPLFRKQPIRSVIERDERLAAIERRQQRRQRRVQVAIVHTTVQFEPVNAGTDADSDRAGSPIETAVGLDTPSFVEQVPNEPGHELRRKLQGLFRCVVAPFAAAAVLLQLLEGAPLDLRVASNGARRAARPDDRPRRFERYGHAFVVERELGAHSIGPRGYRQQPQPRARPADDHVNAEIIRHRRQGR